TTVEIIAASNCSSFRACAVALRVPAPIARTSEAMTGTSTGYPPERRRRNEANCIVDPLNVLFLWGSRSPARSQHLTTAGGMRKKRGRSAGSWGIAGKPLKNPDQEG